MKPVKIARPIGILGWVLALGWLCFSPGLDGAPPGSGRPVLVTPDAAPAPGMQPSALAPGLGPVAEIKLTGIYQLAGRKRALLEITGPVEGRNAQGRVIVRYTWRPILREGEREGACSVLEIDEKKSFVRVRNGDQEQVLTIPHEPDDELANRTLNLKSAHISQVLEIYQELSGRTILATYRWRDAKVDVKSDAGLSTKEAVALLEKTLLGQGLSTQTLEDKAVFVLPTKELPSLEGRPQRPPADAPVAGKNEVFEAGLIKFNDAELNQVLAIYQEISGRTVLRASLPATKITIKSQTALTRQETIWLFDTLFYMHGLGTKRLGEKAVAVVLAKELGLLDGLPAVPNAKAGGKAGDGKEEVFEAGLIKFVQADISQVLDIYQEMSGRTVLGGSLPNVCKITVKSQTALTREEAIWLLDALFYVNGMAMVREGQQWYIRYR